MNTGRVLRASAAPKIAVALLAASCTDRPPPVTTDPHLIGGEFADEFWVGDEASEQQFVDIASMAFAPGGDLVVVDGDAYLVTVFDVGGREVVRWGNRGEGPGEFPRPPRDMAVSEDGVVAISNSGRVDVFGVGGDLIESHPVEPLMVTDIAFDRERNVLVKARSPVSLSQAGPTEIVRLADGEALWSSKPLPSVRSLQLLAPHVVMAEIGGGRIAVGVSHTYDMEVIDASTGQKLGRIARDVPIRGPTEDFVNRFKETVDWERFQNIDLDDVTFADRFPVTNRILVGPPGRTIWVRRHWGVDDSLAPPVEEMQDRIVSLYDLFSSDTYDYLGTVRIPDRLSLMAGDSTRVAGVYTSVLDEQSVRVMRFSLPQ